MPKGQYQRPKTRGPYKKETGTMVKRVIYLTNEQYEKLKYDSAIAGISYAELLRNILDEFFYNKQFDIDA